MIAWVVSLLLAVGGADAHVFGGAEARALRDSRLIDAVRQKDKAAVRALLQKRVDVNAPQGDGATALHYAVYEDDAELVDMLLAAGANVNTANDLGITPLYLASASGNAAIVTKLLAKGADVNRASENGITPLMEAARSGNVAVVRALITRGAEVNANERVRRQTALMWAVTRHHHEVVKTLLEAHADVRARSAVRQRTVMLDQGPRRIVKTATQDAKAIDVGGSTALLFAAQAGDTESAALLLDAGADVNDTAADGNSALVLATFNGQGAVARLLLARGADPNAAGAGYSALHAAVLRGDLATVTALVGKGADLNALIAKGSPVRRFGSQWAFTTPMTGATPLLVAATYLEVDIMRALLAAGANPAIGLPGGTTPFLAAAGIAVEKEARPSDLVRWNIVDNDTPVIPRAETDVLEATRLLLEAGADVNQANEAGDTAVHAAAAAGLTRVIQLLADRGARLDVKNKTGQTPLALTIPRGRQQEGSKAAEELLRKLGATQ
jgi:ankyrin repeat protein